MFRGGEIQQAAGAHKCRRHPNDERAPCGQGPNSKADSDVGCLRRQRYQRRGEIRRARRSVFRSQRGTTEGDAALLPTGMAESHMVRSTGSSRWTAHALPRRRGGDARNRAGGLCRNCVRWTRNRHEYRRLRRHIELAIGWLPDTPITRFGLAIRQTQPDRATRAAQTGHGRHRVACRQQSHRCCVPRRWHRPGVSPSHRSASRYLCLYEPG